MALPAAGFAEYAEQGVVISAYLLELKYGAGDDVTIVTETIVFANMGDVNYIGDLCIVIPVDAQVMQVSKMGRMIGDAPASVA